MFGRKAPSNPSISLNQTEPMPSFPVLPSLPKEKPIEVKQVRKLAPITPDEDLEEEQEVQEEEQQEEPQEVPKPVARQVKQEVKQQEEPKQEVQVQEEDTDLQMLYNHEARLQTIEAALFRIKQSI